MIPDGSGRCRRVIKLTPVAGFGRYSSQSRAALWTASGTLTCKASVLYYVFDRNARFYSDFYDENEQYAMHIIDCFVVCWMPGRLFICVMTKLCGDHSCLYAIEILFVCPSHLWDLSKWLKILSIFSLSVNFYVQNGGEISTGSSPTDALNAWVRQKIRFLGHDLDISNLSLSLRRYIGLHMQIV